MSRWNDQFEAHPFRTTWGSLKSVLESEDLITTPNESVSIEVARLKKVSAYVDAVLEQIDPELMPMVHLDAMNTHTTNCLSQVNTFKSNQNIGHLHNANTNIDSVIIVLSQSPFILSDQQKGSLAKAAKEYGEAIDSHLEHFGASVDEEVSRVQESASVAQKQITELDATLTNLKGQLQTVEQTIQKQTAEFNSQFSAGEQIRTTKFETTATKLQEKADSEFEELATKAATILEILGKFHDDAAKVFGVVVNTLQAGAYSSYANEEKKTANILRWSAISLMILGVAILVVPEITKFINDSKGYALDWHVTLGRIPFSLILFVPAFYLARESNKHRNTEVLNRRRELILSTIDPYLALLPDDKAEQIKLDIAKGIFSEGTLSTSESSTAESGNVIAQIANLIKQVKDR